MVGLPRTSPSHVKWTQLEIQSAPAHHASCWTPQMHLGKGAAKYDAKMGDALHGIELQVSKWHWHWFHQLNFDFQGEEPLWGDCTTLDNNKVWLYSQQGMNNRWERWRARRHIDHTIMSQWGQAELSHIQIDKQEGCWQGMMNSSRGYMHGGSPSREKQEWTYYLHHWQTSHRSACHYPGWRTSVEDKKHHLYKEIHSAMIQHSNSESPSFALCMNATPFFMLWWGTDSSPREGWEKTR